MLEKTAGSKVACKSWAMAYAACAALVLAYAQIVGPVAFVGDSFYLCDPAKYFTGRSLPGGESLFFFYRPLISFLWAPAYFFERPGDIVLAIQTLNVAFYAASIWPLLILLRDYVKLTSREALWSAFALALGPCALIYAPMLLTEAIYAPIYLFLVLATRRRTETPGLKWDAACGLLLGLCYLSRHAGSIVPVAWALAESTRWVQRGLTGKARLALVKNAAIASGIAAVPIGLWIGVERFLSRGQPGGAGASLLAELAGGHEHAVAWVVNLIQYLLWSPAGFLILAGAVGLLISPKAWFEDTTAVFVLVTTLFAILSTVLFQGSHWGGESLALNRYLAPYVAPLSLVCWRYARQCGRGCLIGAGAAAGIFWALGFPGRIDTHFPDYLAWTKLVLAEMPWWGPFTHAVFGAGMAFGLVCIWRRWTTTMICTLAFLVFVWDAGAAVFWRNTSIARTRPSLQEASEAWAATRRDHDALVVDQDGGTSDYEVVLFRCFYPDQIPEMGLERAVDLVRENQDVRVVTRSRASLGKPFDDRAPVWEFSKNQPAAPANLARIRAFREEDLAHSIVSGRRESVVLLNESIWLNMECLGNAAEIEFEMKVISPRIGRTLFLVNETDGARSSILIPAGISKQGWKVFRIPLKLQPGTNRIRLSADGPVAKIGKRTTRLIVSDKIDIRMLAK